MRFGSVCSGIEAASVAWAPLGWQAEWFSEIEPFACAVLTHRFPTVPNLGDMTTLPDRILAEEVEAPDLICGGTPCQAFSVAGKRAGLSDARGNLSLTFTEIVDATDEVRTRRGLGQCLVFWENVPGVLSTKDNAFGCFLGKLAGSDAPLVSDDKRGRWPNAGLVVGPKRTVVWRVLDAQYFGVPQRRRRVYVVAGPANSGRLGEILFERQSVCGDTAACEGSGQDVAAFIEGSFGAFRESSVAGTVKASGGCIAGGSETICLTDKRVRRLTPVECERLQGFPDNWTRVPYRGKPMGMCPDAPRYKALGNSWAVPVVRWIGKRIERYAT